MAGDVQSELRLSARWNCQQCTRSVPQRRSTLVSSLSSHRERLQAVRRAKALRGQREARPPPRRRTVLGRPLPYRKLDSPGFDLRLPFQPCLFL